MKIDSVFPDREQICTLPSIFKLSKYILVTIFSHTIKYAVAKKKIILLFISRIYKSTYI